MTEVIRYIIQFLLGDHISNELVDFIGYTSNEREYSNYKIIIRPSGFFDSSVYGLATSLPETPLQIWEDSPILFGKPHSELIEGVMHLHADLIASTYFLISRYEEMVRRDCRDNHGRFIGKESLPVRAGFIDSPLVEEYGMLLRNELRKIGIDAPEPARALKKVFLTHDLDQLAHYRSIRGLIGGLIRGISWPKEGHKAIKSFFSGLKFDPWYTYPWLFTQGNSLRKIMGSSKCELILFVRSGGRIKKEDAPILLIHTPDFVSLMKLARNKKVTIGLHTSYEAGLSPHLASTERKILNRLIKKKTNYNRNHYLMSREPEDMEMIIKAGFTDDFTMGYADIAGFRLGTCKPVKWINPITKKLTPFTLHPLTMMDVSLSDKRYMYLNAFDAYAYCTRLIDKVEYWNGELVLLWHNTSVEKNPKIYHRDLYEKLIDYLKNKQKNES
jgi:hypothetical protein